MRVSEAVKLLVTGAFCGVAPGLVLNALAPRHAATVTVQLAAAPSGQICSQTGLGGCAVRWSVPDGSIISNGQFSAADVSQQWGLPDDKLLVWLMMPTPDVEQ